MKKFISFIPGYHSTLFKMLNEENYHIGPCIAMLEIGYEVEMLLYKSNYDIKNYDKSYDERIKLLYTNNFIYVLFYIFKNRNSIIYSNTLTLLSLCLGIIRKKSIFMPHYKVIPDNFIKKIIVLFFYRFFKKIRVINESEEKELKNME